MRGSDKKGQRVAALTVLIVTIKRLFEQVSANAQVTTALVLPLASHMIILRPFSRRAFRDFMRDVGHAVVVTTEANGVKRHHLRCGGVAQLLDLRAIRQGDGVTLAG